MFRKDNVLFISYLLLIFITILLKAFEVFESNPSFNVYFQRLVISVTVSSYLFTISDLCVSNNTRNNYKHYKLDHIAKEIVSMSDMHISILQKKDINFSVTKLSH